MRTVHLLPAAMLIAVLTGCGAGEGDAAPVVTVTATRPAPAETVTETASPEATEETAAPKETETAEETASESSEKRVLPDVVGMNLQEGQDTMQAAGFYILNDKDATGQGRFQVSDRNWVITQQTPAAGKKVSTDTLVTLYAKKIGE